MSMENAILEHATALRELASAIRERNVPINAVVTQIGAAVEEIKTATLTADATQDKAAELADATAKRAAAARDAKAKDELENAVAKVEADAAAEQAGEVVELDYTKDVKPKLLEAIKRTDKLRVQELIKTFGVAKADLVPADKLPELLAKANALV